MNIPSPNPYAPPQNDQSRSVGLGTPDGVVSAQCVQQGWLTRTLLLSGRIQAEVRYLGWTPGERVYVNRVFAGRTRGIYFTVVGPRIDFSIDYDGRRYPATITAEASLLRMLRLVKFSLFINDDLVYEDRLGEP